jgi:glutamate synthase domain-containing protein 2
MQPVIGRQELYRIMDNFLKDENRGISIQLFAELCGLSKKTILVVFVHKEERMTEKTQRRVSMAYTNWKNGEVSIMQNRDKTKFVQYRKEAKPKMAKSMAIEFVNGSVRIKTGIRNKSDYSNYNIDEQLTGKINV